LIDHFLLFIVALISNIFSAFSGGGAGVIQLPAILLLYEMSFITALASHKVATVALGVGATLKYFREIQFDSKFIVVCLILGLPGVVAGASIISMIDDSIARIMLGTLIIIIALYSFSTKNFGEKTTQVKRSFAREITTIMLITLIAMLNGSLSAGTGLIFTVFLIIFYGMDYKTAIAYTLIIVGFFYNLVGAIALGLFTQIKTSIVLPLILGSLFGGYLGAKLSLSKDNKTIKTIYQLVTITVGVSLIL
tara:strand:+ start:2003 stop:2752 length:750 start_codon:yes stop_codon:yes gene_type:complete